MKYNEKYHTKHWAGGKKIARSRDGIEPATLGSGVGLGYQSSYSFYCVRRSEKRTILMKSRNSIWDRS